MKHELLGILVSAYCDGEVSPQERSLVEAHLAECVECAAALEGYRRLGQRVRALPRGEPSRQLWWRLRESLQVRRGRPLWLRWVPLASAAATLLVAVTLVLVFSLGGTRGAERAAMPAAQAVDTPTTGEVGLSPMPTQVLKAQLPPGGVGGGPTQEGMGTYVAVSCPGEPVALQLVGLAVRSVEVRSFPGLLGAVYDAGGRPLPGFILVFSGTAGWKGGAVTGSDGTFALDLPAEGSYQMLLALAGEERQEAADGAWSEAALPDMASLEMCPLPEQVPFPPVLLSVHDEAVLTFTLRVP